MLKIVCLTIFGAKITPPWPPRPRPPGVFTPVVNSPGREISPMVPSSKLRVCELENGLFIVELVNLNMVIFQSKLLVYQRVIEYSYGK